MGREGVLDRLERHHLVVTQDHVAALGLDHDAAVEEPAGKLGVPRLGGRDDVRVPRARELAERLRLRPGNVDCALACVRLVVGVEHLVRESLQAPLRNADEAHRQVHAREPGSCLDHVRDVLEVDHDLVAPADAAHGLDQADRLVRLDHRRPFHCA